MNLYHRTLVIALVALAPFAHAQDKKTIRLVLKPGLVISHTSVTDGKFALTGPADQEFKTKTTFTQDFKFDAGADGWFTFVATTTEFKNEGDAMDMGGVGMTPEDIAAAIKKVKMNGEVNSQGTTRNIAVAGDDGLDMMSKQMMTGISDQMSQLGFFSMSYPEDAIAVGAKWTKPYDLSKSLAAIPFFSNVKGSAPTEYTLEAFEVIDGVEVARIKTFTDGKATFELSMGGGGSGSMTTTASGLVWVNLATGIPVKSDSKVASTIDFGMGNMQQEMSIKSTVIVKG